ncbi:MAG TPA: acetyl-CoA carboxylase biotin carboxyl carrier protein subunit [Bacteroidales bacterium]|jgi:biotin carboxyl carrier protein|nr:acetyl-CoA carboxylase biotin carboxyl carrier protein subunit [Bacteroidales bacterium]
MEEKKDKQSGDNHQELKKISVMGDTYLTRYTRKFEKRQPWTKPNEKEIISFIPGTIREILVKEGDVVQANQKLMVLEAMKMMNSINAPFAGKIKTIRVHIGDCIPKGTLMIEFE